MRVSKIKKAVRSARAKVRPTRAPRHRRPPHSVVTPPMSKVISAVEDLEPQVQSVDARLLKLEAKLRRVHGGLCKLLELTIPGQDPIYCQKLTKLLVEMKQIKL